MVGRHQHRAGPKAEGHEAHLGHAAWGETEIAEFDEKLSFKGRIEREGWVEQAKALAAEKE